MDSARFFYNQKEAVLVRRPNRFLIIAGSEGEEIPCHCPNPGRLIEFMFPGMPLILEGKENGDHIVTKESKGRKTDWTVVGVRYQDMERGGASSIVPLYSARANQVAKALVLPRIIPGLAQVRGEYVLGDSRFDFLCIAQDGTRHLVEVKSCSLVEHGVAMFPDAPSLRAGKHVRELAALSREGYCCHVLFLIGHGSPRVFVPNLHTDPDFAAALWEAGDALHIHATLVRCDEQGMAVLAAESIPVNLEPGRLARENCGSYLVVLEVPETADITVGALGTLHFQAGWYV
jgi:sugar fermentation stimulation protein A